MSSQGNSQKQSNGSNKIISSNKINSQNKSNERVSHQINSKQQSNIQTKSIQLNQDSHKQSNKTQNQSNQQQISNVQSSKTQQQRSSEKESQKLTQTQNISPNILSKKQSNKNSKQKPGQQKVFGSPTNLRPKTNQKKEKTGNFFQATKIDTCSYVKIINGKPFAMPYYERPQSSYADTMARSTEFSSVTRDAFQQKVTDTPSSGKKKLEPYNPDACRNRLPIQSPKMPVKNASSLQFGDRTQKNKKAYVSTQKNQYGNFANMQFMANPMIMAEKAKWHHKKQNN